MSEEVVQPDTEPSSAQEGLPRKMRKVEDELGASYAVPGDGGITQTILEDVDNCQAQIDDLNELASAEILAIEQKYNKLRKPFYDKRNELIKTIPNFWVTAFVNHPQISAILTEEEEECLHYLLKVDVEEFDDIKSGYRIKFHFQSNPYFDNEVLCKEFSLMQTDAMRTPTDVFKSLDLNIDPCKFDHYPRSKNEATGETVSISEPVRWKDEEVDLTKTIPEEMPGQRRRRSGLVQTFFTWYLDNMEPHMDDIAEVIKDDVWPNPLRYYLAPDVEVEENGVDSDEEAGQQEEVVIGSDDDDDEDGAELADGQELPEEVLLDDEEVEEGEAGVE